MKIPHFLAIVALLCAAPAHAVEPASAGKDDASQSAYGGGWNEAGGGTGFGNWKFQEYHAAANSYAGHLVNDNSGNADIGSFASNGKVFDLYANGSEFESAAAFRSFSTPLQTGQTFSFQMKNAVIEQKGQTDNPGAGAIGLTLRNGNAADAPDDYNKGARFELANLKGQANYQVFDGEASHDSGVAYSPPGIAVTVTLTSADTYDLQITTLGDNKSTKLSGRKLGGSGNIESFCIFNRNGEKADGFFNSFEVSAHGK